MKQAVSIPKRIADSIRAQAEEEKPNEACGYLIGKDDKAHIFHRMTNIDNSSQHFTFDPVEQFEALNRARSHGLDLICVYHSHPNTPSRMSEEDKLLAYDTSSVYVIYSMVDDSLKAFTITFEKVVSEIEIHITREVAAS